MTLKHVLGILQTSPSEIDGIPEGDQTVFEIMPEIRKFLHDFKGSVLLLWLCIYRDRIRGIWKPSIACNENTPIQIREVIV